MESVQKLQEWNRWSVRMRAWPTGQTGLEAPFACLGGPSQECASGCTTHEFLCTMTNPGFYAD